MFGRQYRTATSRSDRHHVIHLSWYIEVASRIYVRDRISRILNADYISPFALLIELRICGTHIITGVVYTFSHLVISSVTTSCEDDGLAQMIESCEKSITTVFYFILLERNVHRDP